MATKSEGIAETSTYHTLLGFIESEVQIVVDLWIIIALLVVDGGRNDIVLNSQNSYHSLNSTGSTKQMTCH